MNIAYFTNQYPAPSHTFIRREILALEARGHCIHRYAIRQFHGELRDPDDVAELQRTRHLLEARFGSILLDFVYILMAYPLASYRAFRLALRFAAASRGNFFRHMAYFVEATILARWCLADNIRHLHVHFGTNPATVAALAHEICGVPFSMTVHGPEEFDQPSSISLGLKASLSAFTIAVSSFGRSQLMRWTDLADWQKLHVVRCGVDDSYSLADGPVVSNENRLICVARLSEQKGHLILLQAAAMLVREGIDFQLVLAGDGPLRSQIEHEIDRLALREVVTLTGSVSQTRVRAEIGRSKAMVLASFAEGLPVVLMESMALRRPAIATYIAGIPELVLPGSGWLVPAGDVKALANAMRLVLAETDEQLATMGEAARRHALEMHDISASAALLETLIEQSISSVGMKSARDAKQS